MTRVLHRKVLCHRVLVDEDAWLWFALRALVRNVGALARVVACQRWLVRIVWHSNEFTSANLLGSTTGCQSCWAARDQRSCRCERLDRADATETAGECRPLIDGPAGVEKKVCGDVVAHLLALHNHRAYVAYHARLFALRSAGANAGEINVATF